MKKLLLGIIFLVVNSIHAQILEGGNGHALILDKSGQVWTVGRNDYGQIGDSTLENTTTPKKVPAMSNIAAVARGYDHSLALDSNGYLYAWGRNNYGQLGLPTVLDVWVPQQVPNHKDFIAVAGGHWHTAALKSDGTVWCWGHNFFGELGNDTREHSNFLVQVVQKGPKGLEVLKDVVQIATVGYFTLAIKKDGTVWGWGANTLNQLGKAGAQYQKFAIPIPGIPKMKEVAVGWNHVAALDLKGNIWVWGSYPETQDREFTGKFHDKPVMFTGLPKMTKVACGSWHALAIDENKRVWGWGRNDFGMLGIGEGVSTSTPVMIESLENIVDIGGGCFQSLALNESGQLFTFGDNPFGQMGLGNYDRCFFPVQMPLDVDGNLNLEEPELIAEVPIVVENQKAENQYLSFWELVKKVLKYGLFLLSVLLNIFFFRKLKQYRSSTTNPGASGTVV